MSSGSPCRSFDRPGRGLRLGGAARANDVHTYGGRQERDTEIRTATQCLSRKRVVRALMDRFTKKYTS